ncbi:hypothetical protein EJ08DRAFT_158355 [Tothia fuscella]|uniref:Cnl2/NKP2 family protein-domain-containing protein n=1 Tax=Tothia fuscella TaxID=1048955 RepID=A0A9P4NVI0_9PEZI|nr:hypothetical protein EJ08DRAFT_158355 [Tothia fuscella]
MSTTEEAILSNFLLPPASLSEGLTLEQFTELFPKSKQSSAHISKLYRELKRQRARDVEDVKRNIAAEAQREEKQSRDVRRSRRTWHEVDLQGFDERDVQMETDLFGQAVTKSTSGKPHTLQSILPEMDATCTDLTEEIRTIDEEAEAILADIKATIGDLSDMRTGKFNRTPGSGTDLGEDVLDGLRKLEQICDDVGKG